VEGRGKNLPPASKVAWLGLFQAGVVQNRLPARIFTVDFLHRRRRIRAVRFPNSAITIIRAGLGWA
jgi:hypothetical protein